ncbi:MAG: hypothetical protein AAGG02_02530 [Cyanobacteria bacterium P01_H01_bin.15]
MKNYFAIALFVVSYFSSSIVETTRRVFRRDEMQEKENSFAIA